MRRLHPRVAVLLGVNNQWHKWLFVCRLLSVAPELKLGLPLLWTLLRLLTEGPPTVGSSGVRSQLEQRLWPTEMLLSALWCAVAGYLSFFCTDCLMMRWLLYYTPGATIIRLITANAFNYIFTSALLERSGSNLDLRLLFPAWILIAVSTGVVYLVIHGRTTIRRENDYSLAVFGTASFCSMCFLLFVLHLDRYVF